MFVKVCCLLVLSEHPPCHDRSAFPRLFQIDSLNFPSKSRRMYVKVEQEGKSGQCDDLHAQPCRLVIAEFKTTTDVPSEILEGKFIQGGQVGAWQNEGFKERGVATNEALQAK